MLYLDGVICPLSSLFAIGTNTVNTQTEINYKIGLIGRGIQLSRTPFMHEAEGKRLGLDYQYDLIDVDLMGEAPPSISEILGSLEMDGYAGVNVTYPFKQSVMEFIDDFSHAALAVGSVNTVIFDNGKRTGHNTDVTGFEQSYLQNMEGRSQGSVLLIGAGGAGVSVAHALLKCGVGKLYISDIDESAVQTLVGRLNGYFDDKARCVASSDLQKRSATLDGVVNATPVGMEKIPGCPFPKEMLSERLWVADIIYFPLETELLKTARNLGCHTLSGSEMAVYQALHAFELFTGLRPDGDAMKASFAAYEN